MYFGRLSKKQDDEVVFMKQFKYDFKKMSILLGILNCIF